MKNSKITCLIMATSLFVFTGLNLKAQEKNKMMTPNKMESLHEMLNLTEDQEAKINELKTAHMKEMLPLKNKLNELQAKQQTLSTAEKPDIKAINTNIDEMTKVNNAMMKQKAALQQDIRAILTDEQRVKFDSFSHQRFGKHGFRHDMKNGHKRHFQHDTFGDN